MPSYQSGIGALPGGLLRGLAETESQSPIAEAGFDPAQAGLIQEPLSRTPPPGTSQVIANKPALDINQLQSMLQNMPVPSPKDAARLIAAMVSQPQGQVLGQQAATAPAPQPQARGVTVRASTGMVGPSRLGSQSVTTPGGIGQVLRKDVVGGAALGNLLRALGGFLGSSGR